MNASAQVVKIGFMGVQCDNPNLGVAALAYSIVGIAHRLVPGEAEFRIFSENSSTELRRMAESLDLDNKKLVALPIRHRDPVALRETVRSMRECRLIFDLTGGDSFSDIYGIRRLLIKLFDKQLALISRSALIIAPQTVGPFRNRLILPWVRHVVNHAALVCTRDLLSHDFLATLTSREVVPTTDVAVTLPSGAPVTNLPPQLTPRVALNVSGLLWNGGYTGRNQFGLRADYQKYCHMVTTGLLEDGYEVHLVPHVLARGKASGEDDEAAAAELGRHYPDCVLAPAFHSPVEAKSYIAMMDAFIGARMHATIAALTMGIATVPVAYSRKFAGLYGNLGYDVVIDLAKLSTSDAVDQTLGLVRRRDELRRAAVAAEITAQNEIRRFLVEAARFV